MINGANGVVWGGGHTSSFYLKTQDAADMLMSRWVKCLWVLFFSIKETNKVLRLLRLLHLRSFDYRNIYLIHVNLPV